MKFDVVVGNPPYNNDMYIDFVLEGHKLSRGYDIWITPAKWQATGDFDSIKSSIKELVYYPDCGDVFNILLTSGVVYYIVDNINLVSSCRVVNRSKLQPLINSVLNRRLGNNSLHNIGSLIHSRLSDIPAFSIDTVSHTRAYKVFANRTWSPMGGSRGWFNLFSKRNGDITLTSPAIIQGQKNSTTISICIYSNDNIDFCRSFIFWYNTKFIRYMVLCGIYAYGNVLNNKTWRFVPDPGSFNRVFEDAPLDGYIPDENGEYTDSDGNRHCSLYVKYKLTNEEINIIESVIRERG